ncbi:MAG: hypothetical protein DYG96_03070 [Chlorobi bacterium CHB2]|nr:hypothetical protein [Chlorobi bacterium CHB2]
MGEITGLAKSERTGGERIIKKALQRLRQTQRRLPKIAKLDSSIWYGQCARAMPLFLWAVL